MRSRAHHYRRLARTGLLIAALLVPAAAWGTGSPEAHWRFRVLLDGAEIGHHELRIRGRDGLRQVQSEAHFRVRFLGLEVYRYRHQASEVWDGDCLQRIDADTDDNGRPQQVSGKAEGTGFVVRSGEVSRALPDCTLSFAYWKPRNTSGREAAERPNRRVPGGGGPAHRRGLFASRRPYFERRALGLAGRRPGDTPLVRPRRPLAGVGEPHRGGRVLRYELVDFGGNAASAAHTSRSVSWGKCTYHCPTAI